MKKRTGIVQGLYEARDQESFVTSTCPNLRLTFAGIEGDRHAGLTRPADSRVPHYPRGTEIRNTRQLSLVSVEELQEIAAGLGVPQVLPEWLGANLLVSGIPALTRLTPGTRLFFPGEAVLVVDEENMPCKGPGKVLQAQYPEQADLVARFIKTGLHRRGVTAWVERPGMIAAGDTFEAHIPVFELYPF